ncbi:MAG: tetratricopeptide repeat protein [Bacteroidales bacterium]|nr:tetratricopeptide repeat protein [Bacteroidales bacterium]
MKTKIFATMILGLSITAALFAQTPMDPVIAKFNEGAANVNGGDYTAAIGNFEEVISMAEGIGADANDLKAKAQDQLPVLYYTVATSYMKQKKYEEAIPSLEKTVDLANLYKNNAEVKAKAMKYLPTLLTGVGSVKYKEQNFDAAQELFDKTIEFDPEYAKAYLGKGLIYSDQFKEKEMVENLNKAISLAKASGDDKTAEQAQIALGLYYINQGHMDMQDVDPESPDYEYAIGSFEKAVSFNPNAADAYYMLAVIYNQESEFDKAIESAKNALAVETDADKLSAINYELGNAYFDTADYPNACEAYGKATSGDFAEKAKIKKEKVPGCQ